MTNKYIELLEKDQKQPEIHIEPYMNTFKQQQNLKCNQRFMVQMGILENTLYCSDLVYGMKMNKNVDKTNGVETHKIGLICNGPINDGFRRFGDGLGPVMTCSEVGYTGGLEHLETCRMVKMASHLIVIHDVEHIKDVKKHVGNDAVQVVWDEGEIPYRPWSISGDFGDVIIVVRPMGENAFITVYKKGFVGHIGPLFGSMQVKMAMASELVMMTVVNALQRLSNKVWSDSKQSKLYPVKNRELCIEYYKTKFFVDSKKEQLANALVMENWK